MSDTQTVLNRLIEIGDEIEEITGETSQEIANGVWLGELPVTAEFMNGLLESIRQMQKERFELESEALGLLSNLI